MCRCVGLKRCMCLYVYIFCCTCTSVQILLSKSWPYPVLILRTGILVHSHFEHLLHSCPVIIVIYVRTVSLDALMIYVLLIVLWLYL